MRESILFAALAGLAWGTGGFMEKAGLKALGLPALGGITLRSAVALVVLGALSLPAWKALAHPRSGQGWLLLVVGGGLIAGSLGMWSFYRSLETSTNLGVSLAIAFAGAPVAGTAIGLLRGTQNLSWTTSLGLLAIIGGTALLQLGRGPG